MRKLTLTLNNIHKWGKPELAKSGDLEVIDSLGREIMFRTKSNKYDVVYATTYDDNVTSLQEMYPSMNLIHFNDYVQAEDDLLIVPSISIGGQKECIDEINQYMRQIIDSNNYVLMNINRDLSYYDSLMNSMIKKGNEETALLIRQMIIKAKLFINHNEKDINFYADICGKDTELFEAINNNFCCFGQLAFYDQQDEIEQYPTLLAGSFTLSTFEAYAANNAEYFVTFHRPSRLKGTHLWYKEVLENKKMFDNSVMITRSELLPNKKELSNWFSDNLYVDYLKETYSYENNEELFSKSKNLDFYKLFNAMNDYNNQPRQLLNELTNSNNSNPLLLDSSYDFAEDSFKDFISSYFTNYMIYTDYHYTTNKSYLIIENAMIDALEMGLKLTWSSYSIETMPSKVADEALLLNSMNISEQRNYLYGKLSVGKWINSMIEELYLNERR